MSAALFDAGNPARPAKPAPEAACGQCALCEAMACRRWVRALKHTTGSNLAVMEEILVEIHAFAKDRHPKTSEARLFWEAMSHLYDAWIYWSDDGPAHIAAFVKALEDIEELNTSDGILGDGPNGWREQGCCREPSRSMRAASDASMRARKRGAL